MLRLQFHLVCSAASRARTMSTAAPVPAARSPCSVSSSGFSGPVAQRIQAALVARFSPTHLEVHNESHNHSATQESHFKVVIVSEAFEGKPLLDRHRSINASLADEFAAGLHALSIGKAATPAQWGLQTSVNQSPACLGGAKFDRMRAEALEKKKAAHSTEASPSAQE